MRLASLRHRHPAWLLVLVVLAGAFLPGPARGQERVRHVASDGTDTSPATCAGGTATEPWRTIAFAFRCLRAGDTLHVHAGTYRERVSVPTRPGRGDAPIVVTGAPREPRPRVQGGLRINDPSWWTIQDIEVVGDGGDYDAGGAHPLKLLGGEHWTVQRVELRDAAAYALLRVVPGTDGSPAAHWTIRDSCIHDTIPAHGTPHEPPYPDHNVYVYTGNDGGPGLIEGNVIYGAPNGQNIKLGEGSGIGATDRVVLRFNTLVDAAQNVTVTGPSDDNVTERNVLADVKGEPWYPNVRGIHLSGTGNLVEDNAWWGAAEVVHNRTGNQTAVRDGGNRRVGPGFEGDGCAALYPIDPAARDTGAWSRDYLARRVDERGRTAPPVDRIAGDDRHATAVRVSQETRGAGSTRTAVLARGDTYPDALAASGLTGLVDGPVLLVERDGPSAMLVDELRRLGVERVVLLGGEQALPEDVERRLRDSGVKEIQRLAGRDRFATAARVADEVARVQGRSADHVVLVEGASADPARGWPDAVAAGPLAASRDEPILLSLRDELPDATERWLGTHRPARVTVVGGPAAVSDAVVRRIEALGAAVERVWGQDRLETAEAVAERLVVSADAERSRVFVASSRAFPDALTAGPAAAHAGGVLLLHGVAEGPDRVREFLREAEGAPRVSVVGGGAAVSYGFEDRWSRSLVVTP